MRNVRLTSAAILAFAVIVAACAPEQREETLHRAAIDEARGETPRPEQVIAQELAEPRAEPVGERHAESLLRPREDRLRHDPRERALEETLAGAPAQRLLLPYFQKASHALFARAHCVAHKRELRVGDESRNIAFKYLICQVYRALLAFLHQASDRVHAYVTFIGD